MDQEPRRNTAEAEERDGEEASAPASPLPGVWGGRIQSGGWEEAKETPLLSLGWSRSHARGGGLWRDGWQWGWVARPMEQRPTLKLELSYPMSHLSCQVPPANRT